MVLIIEERQSFCEKGGQNLKKGVADTKGGVGKGDLPRKRTRRELYECSKYDDRGPEAWKQKEIRQYLGGCQ